jgi:hypothetical protein
MREVEDIYQWTGRSEVSMYVSQSMGNSIKSFIFSNALFLISHYLSLSNKIYGGGIEIYGGGIEIYGRIFDLESLYFDTFFCNFAAVSETTLYFDYASSISISFSIS